MRSRSIHLTAIALLVLSLFVFVAAVPVRADKLAQRRVDIGSSEPLATTGYDVFFDLPASSPLGSIVMEFCGNSPLPEIPCVAPTGFSATGAVLANQTGETGFVINAGSTTNRLILSRAPAPSTATSVSYSFDDVVNPQTANQSYYARLSTYASNDGTGPQTDDGSVALSTAEQINVNAYVPPYLQFCVGLSILSHECGTATGNQVNVGTLQTDNTASGISKFLAATNAPGGYTVQISGAPMASGNNVITSLTNPTASMTGSEQFGLNLRANTDPAVGLEPSGPGDAQPTTRYNQVNNFTFGNGDIIANSPSSNDRVTFTASYIININDSLPVGRYSTTLTYICTGSF